MEHCEKKAQKNYRTFLVNNLPVPTRVRKLRTCFLWLFLQSFMDTTEDVYRHSVMYLYPCAFSVLKHEIFSSVADNTTPRTALGGLIPRRDEAQPVSNQS